MPRLHNIPRNKVVSILEEYGYQEARHGTSHTVMVKLEMSSEGPRIAGKVAVPNHDPIVVRELLYIIKSAEIPRRDFE